MMPVSGYDMTMAWGMGGTDAMSMRGASGVQRFSDAQGFPDMQGASGVRGRTEDFGISPAEEADPGAKPGYKSSPEDCETCRERKYQDGSDENVSFKAASHISPEAAASRVRAHESEHVANAYSKAAEKGGKVLNASVSIHTAICPECGRTYVSGGTTNTLIRYPNEDNPYQQNKKAIDGIGLRGQNLDIAV